MPGWFDEQGITGYQPVQQPQGQAGAELGAPMRQQAPRQQQPFNLEAFQARATELSKGLKGTNAEFQQILYPQLAQEFGGIERFGSKGDKIRLPGGGVIDAVLSAGLGGKGFQFGLEGPARPKPMAMPTLGSIGQASPQMPRFDPASVDIGTQPAPTLDQFSQALQAAPQAPPQPAPQVFAPQTVQGPEPMKLPGIPGFANGVQNYSGGPALVGERGPELVNLPQGSDVIPLAPPLIGGGSAINFGAGGASPAPAPLMGGPQALDMGNGGVNPSPAPMMGGPAAQGAPQGGFNYNPMAAPSNYNPQALQGPDRLTLGSIGRPGAVNAQQVGPGQQVSAGTVQTGGPVGFDRVSGSTVQTPAQIAAERVQGPAALQAQQLGNAPTLSNLSLSQFQADPSYQFDLKQQLGAVQNSAAAKGMLHHPNTIRGLQETSSQIANRQYDTVNARNLGVQQQNFGNQATVAGANNAANAQAYGLTNQFQQQAALANQATGLEAGKFNVSTGLQAGMFNAQQQQQAALANQQAGLQSGMFNSGQQQQANLANVGNQLQAGQFNSAQGQQAALANQGANLQAGTFNAGMDFQTQQANIGNQLAAYNAYQPLAQQNQQFNAAQQASAAQNNFANAFSVNQANNAGALGQFNANLGAELGRGNLALGNRQADQSYALGNKQADNSYALGQGNLALGNRSADQSYDLGLRNNALGNRQADQSYSLGLGNLGVSQGQLDLSAQGQNYNQDLNTFNTNYGVFRDNRDSQFDQNYRLATLGQNAAGNYGNAAGNAYINQGAANGNAGMAGAGAWGGALGTIGNIAGQAGAYWGANQPQQPQPYNGAIPWRE